MISGRINLAKFKHVLTKKKNKAGEEVDCIVIPIDMNELFMSDSGNVFLDIVAFDSDKPEYKQTHAVKQSIPKEKRDSMSEEEKNSYPFIGHLNSKYGLEAAPNVIPKEDGFESDDDEDGLPF